MATKRAASRIHPSRRDQVPDEPRRKRQKPDNAGPKAFKKAHPVNELKSQIRSLKRLLEHNDALPANVRVEKERALQTAQYELEEGQQAMKRSEMIGRYHKIRFFDRQKASKHLKRARKELQACDDADGRRPDIMKKVEDTEVDVNYAQYYPLDQPYVSLFPRRKVDNDTEDVEGDLNEQEVAVERKGDQQMWLLVKQCMSDGTLEALRNGRLTREEDGKNEGLPISTARKKQKDDIRSQVRTDQDGDRAPVKISRQSESDDESGGGFFE